MDLITSNLYTQAAGEHKSTEEQNIRTIKDRTISTVYSVPYRKMPLLMIELILEQEQSMLNAFTTKTGISTTLPEINIVEGRPSLDYNTMSLKIRAYIQLYE